MGKVWSMPMTYLSERLGDLRELRERADLTRAELSEKSGVSAETIRLIEVGRITDPRRGTVRKLACALGVSTSDLNSDGVGAA